LIIREPRQGRKTHVSRGSVLSPFQGSPSPRPQLRARCAHPELQSAAPSGPGERISRQSLMRGAHPKEHENSAAHVSRPCRGSILSTILPRARFRSCEKIAPLHSDIASIHLRCFPLVHASAFQLADLPSNASRLRPFYYRSRSVRLPPRGSVCPDSSFKPWSPPSVADGSIVVRCR
jgi:hypothetical protein